MSANPYALSKIYPRIYTSKNADALGQFRPEKAPIIATGVRALVLTAAQGTYNETGQTTNLLWKRLITAAQGTYNETGQTTNFVHGYTIVAAQGTYNETGQTTSLLRNRLLAAVQGLYGDTGQTTSLLWKHVILASQGLYSETGQTTNLIYAQGRILSAATGLFSLTGSPASFIYTPLAPVGPQGGISGYLRPRKMRSRTMMVQPMRKATRRAEEIMVGWRDEEEALIVIQIIDTF